MVHVAGKTGPVGELNLERGAGHPPRALGYPLTLVRALRDGELVVRPGGAVASLEFFVPPNAAWRLSWQAYTRLLLPAAGFVTGGREWAAVGRFLGPSITWHYRRYPVAWTVDAWHDAGIQDVTVRPMSLGGGLVMWGRKADG